jgi:hypothetical protein
MTKFLSGLGLAVSMLLLGFPLLFLKTHIIMDLGVLWEIEQIGELGYNKVLGIMLIIGFFNLKKPKTDPEDKDKSHVEQFFNALGSFLTMGFLMLVGWGFSYLVHIFI